nr:hypothetical protein BaRGS_007270 [Batillaria attramentaria]
MDSNNVQLLLNRKPKFKDVLDPLIKHRKDLTEKGTKNYRLHLIIDEATWYLGFFVQTLERELQGFGLTHLSLWAASTFHGFKPKSFKEMKMTRSIRCPPAVVREIQKGGAYAMRAVYPYPDLDAGVLSSQPPPTDGPPVKRIEHDRDHKGDVWDCETCGEELARFLKDDLQIGSVTSQDRLKFSHVFVSGHVRFPPPGALTGFLKGLSVTGGVPYDVIRKEDGFYTEKLAHPTDDKVQLVHPACLAQLVVIEDVDVSMVRGMDRFSVN